MRVSAFAAAFLLIGTVGASPATAHGLAPVAALQETVTVQTAHVVRTAPALSARAVESVASRRPITGTQTVLPVAAHAVDAHGSEWLEVRLPGRSLHGIEPPAVGWIQSANTVESATQWHIVVDLRTRTTLVYFGGRVVRAYRAIIGTRATPTPRGEFFVEENVRLPTDRVGAPFALATSARSGVLQEFAGGPGQVALHGLGGVGGTLGTAASHGCVRLANSAIAWLAARIAPGTPVTIVPG